MKKITKTLVAIILIAVLSLTGITASASNYTVSPRWTHLGDANIAFVATATGGHIEVSYDGYESFARADLTVKVEKRFLWAFWNDIGEWSASSTNNNGYFSHTFDLNGSGTYRATFTLKITGSNGTVDTIEETIESKY